MSPLIEERLARHALLHAEMVSEAACGAAWSTLLDIIACMLAGLRSPECAALARLYRERGGKEESTAVGVRQRLPMPSAAALNAALAHWNEWDDLHDVAIIHASAVIWPVLLAIAEATGKDTPAHQCELVASAAVAFDIASRIGSAITPYAHNGWYATAPGAAVGAAAGAGRLFGLSREAIHSAMGLAASAAGFMRQPLLDRVNGKNALCAQTATVVMNAVDLARSGVVGARRFLTGDYGFNAMMADGRANAATGIDDLGIRFSITEMSVKPFPCCRATHQTIDLALQLRERSPSVAADIASVHVRVPQPTYDLVGAPFAPGSNPRVSAQFSIPYTLALALQNGRVALDDFVAERVLTNEAVRETAAKVTVEAFPIAPGQGQYDLPVEMTCILTDGTPVRVATDVVIGSPSRPLTEVERHSKLTDCASAALTTRQVEHLEVLMRTRRLADALALLRGAHGL